MNYDVQPLILELRMRAMARPLDEVLAGLPPDERLAVKHRAEQLARETQTAIATSRPKAKGRSRGRGARK